MAARYFPGGHPLLIAAARELDLAVLDVYAEAVERELGLRGRIRYSGDRKNQAILAVVYGVNCMMLRDKLNLASQRKGDQARTFREREHPESWCAKAKKMAAELTRYTLLQSIR